MLKMARVIVAMVTVLACGVGAWPGMRRDKGSEGAPAMIGPTCTLEAHSGPWLDAGPCPNMKQPARPPGSGPPVRNHTWPTAFVVDWEFVFVADEHDPPPYNPRPKSPHNVSYGHTYYHAYDEASGVVVNMRESYSHYCIPVFGGWGPHFFFCLTTSSSAATVLCPFLLSSSATLRPHNTR